MSKTWSFGAKLPDEEEELEKLDEPLALTVRANEKQKEDRDVPAGPEESGQIELVVTVAEETLVDASVQVDEESLLGLEKNESELIRG